MEVPLFRPSPKPPSISAVSVQCKLRVRAMRTRHLVLFLTGTVPYWFLSRVVFCYDEAPWQPVQYDYYHIDLGELAGDQDQGFASRSSKLPTPSDAIVDVINNLGIKLLAIHNERNENNIAISPYGAFSVLAALTEGLQGESVHEILHAAHVPYDQQIVRVGLRDIHRHLKSYFIPEEGFLAGLTLNLNNITLKSDYQDVLKFYGFDYGSFNNALYPDPPTTKKSAEGTTLETGLGVSEDSPTSVATTTEQPQNTEVEVANRASDDIPTTTEVATTNMPTTTLASVESTTSEPEVIMETTTEAAKTTEVTETAEAATSTEGTSTPPSVETMPPTEPPEDTTTATAVVETLQLNAANQTPSGTSKDTTSARVTSVTSSSAAKIPGGYTSTKQFETTAEYHHTTSSDSETSSSNTGTPSIISSEGLTGNTVRTTREVTESIQSSIGETSTTISTNSTASSTISYSTESTELQQTTTETPKSISVQTVEAETTAEQQFTKKEVTTETTLMPYTATQLLSTSETFSSAETTESTSELTSPKIIQTVLSTGTTTETTFILTTLTNGQSGITGAETTLEPTSSSLTTLESDNSVSNQQDNLETTSLPFFGTTPNFQGTPANQGNFDFNNYNYNENTPVYDDEEVVENTDNNNFKRSVRSVADYIISRIYDDGSQFVPLTQRTQYVPEDSMTFAVYGKYREPVAFMKYDTVLPYFFAPNINAVALSFPLDSSKYYLLLLLPLRDDGIDQLIYDLRISGSLKYVIENLRLAHVQATIPSFTLKGYVTLTPTLQKLGIRQIFEPRQADFSPMTNSTDIFVTNIEQAVTVTIRNYLDPSAQRYKNYQQYPPITFKADHPFLYFVVDSELHVALMVGKVINPLNSRIS